MTDIDEQSIGIVIQPPQKTQVQTSISPPSKQHLKDVDIKYKTQEFLLTIYIMINKVYLNHLIEKKQVPKFPPALREYLGNNCIIYKQFKVDQHYLRQFLTKNPTKPTLKANIQFYYINQLHLEFRVYFRDHDQFIDSDDYVWVVINYRSGGLWKIKNIAVEYKQRNYSFKIDKEQLNELTQSNNLLIQFAIRKKQKSNSQYLGMVNLGNTCYMNSSLQMLYFLKPLRKIVYEKKQENKIIDALRNVFCNLMDPEEEDPVDIQNLLKVYDKFNQYPRRQQDVQQFLLDFINELQKQCPELKILWQGKCSYTTISKQSQKPYKSTQNEQFSQLDVHMFNHQNKYFQTIQQSLESLLHEEDVDELIQNDDYGKIKVAKYRKFQTLPDILFINLKRYQFDRERYRMSKVFHPIRYGLEINVSFLVETPGNQQKNQDYDYTLFSLIVHKGSSPQSGHYFSFVNTSKNLKTPQWQQFNDSIVRRVTPEQVLKFNQNKIKDIFLDKQNGTYVEKQIASNQTSYLLVYIRQAVFNDFQNISTPMPKEYIQQKLQKKKEQQRQKHEILSLTVLNGQEQKIELFLQYIQFITIPVNKECSVLQELKKIQTTYLGCQIQHVFKVNINDKKLKFLLNCQTAKSILPYRKGITPTDYFLIISNTVQNYSPHTPQKQIGLVNVTRNDLASQESSTNKTPNFFIIGQLDLYKWQEEIGQKGGKVNYLTSKQDFQQGWNLYLEVQIINA